MTKEEIIKYVLSSPENTNPNVLEGMLDELSNNSGGGEDNMVVSLFENPDNEYYLSNYETKEIVTYMDIVNYIKEGKMVQYIVQYDESQYSAAGASAYYFYEAYKQYNGTTYYIKFLSYSAQATNNYRWNIVEFTSQSKDGYFTRTGD